MKPVGPGVPRLMAPEAGSAREALRYFATAFVLFLSGVTALAWNSRLLASGNFSDPKVLGSVHLITLGWLSLSIFGALQVFVGVALGSLPSPSLSRWIRRTWVLGTILFVAGFMAQVPPLLAFGASTLGAGLVLLTAQLVPALASAKRGNLTRAYVTVALLSLWFVWGLGGLAALARAGLATPALPPGYLSAHILIAVFGWVGAMIAGVGSHLVPMFALSKATSELPVRLALPLWGALPFTGAWSAFRPGVSSHVAWSLAAGASLLWCLQLVLFLRNRLRREKDAGLFLAGVATAFLPAGWFVLLLNGRPTIFVALMIVGWLSYFTLGIYHRVVPFLIWFIRFAPKMGKGPVPKVGELLNSRIAQATAGIGPIGVIVWAIGLGRMDVHWVAVGSVLILVSVLLAGLQAISLSRPFKTSLPNTKGVLLDGTHA